MAYARNAVKVVSALAGLCLLPGCAADTATGPAPQMSRFRGPTASSISATEMTVVTPRGAFTLNTERSELRVPNGAVITHIPTDVMTSLANGMEAYNANNGVTLENALLANGYNPGGPIGSCSDGSSTCEQAVVPGRRGGRDSRATSFWLGARPTPRKGSRTPTGYSGAICNDIAMTIYNKTQQWRHHKARFEEAGRKLTDMELIAGALVRYQDMAELGIAIVEYDMNGRALMYLDVELNFQAYKYGFYDCWNPNGYWSKSSSGVTRNGPTGSNSLYSYLCAWEPVKDEGGNILGWTQNCSYAFMAM